jgi:hypothetical protein
MIVNFADDVDNLYIFLEDGDVEEIEDGVTGPVLDTDRPHFGPGELDVSYDDNVHISRPQIGREVVDGRSIDNFEVVVGDDVYSSLRDDEVYHGRVGSYQDLSSAGKIWFFPVEDRGGYEYLFDKLEFYNDLTEEQREDYMENLGLD